MLFSHSSIRWLAVRRRLPGDSFVRVGQGIASGLGLGVLLASAPSSGDRGDDEFVVGSVLSLH